MLFVILILSTLFRKLSKQVNSSILWSDSQTKHMLTAFGEGLSCKYFDANNSYYVRMINKETLTWFVMSKNVGETEKPPSSDRHEQVLFDRCCRVIVRNWLLE